VLKIVSWNVHQLHLWDQIGDAELALLQECPPAGDLAAGGTVHPADGDWATGDAGWRTAVAIRNACPVEAAGVSLTDLHSAAVDPLGVSRSGTVAAVRITPPQGSPLIVASVYARWEGDKGDAIYADADAHRILSDLSAFSTSTKPRDDLIVAGDWNLLHGYGEDGHPYWKARYDTVFARAEALGLRYLGPEYPRGRRTDPRPSEMPSESLTAPTYRTRWQNPLTATRQLDPTRPRVRHRSNRGPQSQSRP
jgi:hypothetical protein